MKKIKVIAIVLTLVLALGSLVACTPDTVLENTEKDYYVTGQFAGWGDAVGKDQFRMTAVSLKDARVELSEQQYVHPLRKQWSF